MVCEGKLNLLSSQAGKRSATPPQDRQNRPRDDDPGATTGGRLIKKRSAMGNPKREGTNRLRYGWKKRG